MERDEMGNPAPTIPRPYKTISSDDFLVFMGVIFLVFGLIGAIYLLWTAGTIFNRPFQPWGAGGVHQGLMIGAIVAFVQGLLVFAVLKGLADNIRLLKFIGEQVDRSPPPEPEQKVYAEDHHPYAIK